MRKLIKSFRVKYRGAVAEIKDLEREHNKEKEEMLESIRELEKELTLQRTILQIALSEEELHKITVRSRYNEDEKKWRVPLFVLRQKRVNFPNVPLAKREDRQIEFLKRNAGSAEGVRNMRANDANSLYEDKWRAFTTGKKTLADFADTGSPSSVGYSSAKVLPHPSTPLFVAGGKGSFFGGGSASKKERTIEAGAASSSGIPRPVPLTLKKKRTLKLKPIEGPEYQVRSVADSQGFDFERRKLSSASSSSFTVSNPDLSGGKAKSGMFPGVDIVKKKPVSQEGGREWQGTKEGKEEDGLQKSLTSKDGSTKKVLKRRKKDSSGLSKLKNDIEAKSGKIPQSRA